MINLKNKFEALLHAEFQYIKDDNLSKERGARMKPLIELTFSIFRSPISTHEI